MITFEDYFSSTVLAYWKQDTLEAEIEHVRLALLEEAGELCGWYKKIMSYKQDKVLYENNILEELGDILFYLTKCGELNEISMKKVLFEEMPQLEGAKQSETTLLNNLSSLTAGINTLLNYKFKSAQAKEAVVNLSIALYHLATREGYTIQQVAEANKAKLSFRHKEKFADKEEDRDREGELKVIKKSK